LALKWQRAKRVPFGQWQQQHCKQLPIRTPQNFSFFKDGKRFKFVSTLAIEEVCFPFNLDVLGETCVRGNDLSIREAVKYYTCISSWRANG
jgi:hypothetical protein